MARPRKESTQSQVWSCFICAGNFIVPQRSEEPSTYVPIRKGLVRFVHLLQIACDDKADLKKHVESVYSSKDGGLAAKYDEIKKALLDAKEEREFNDAANYLPLYHVWAEKNHCWKLWLWANKKMETNDGS